MDNTDTIGRAKHAYGNRIDYTKYNFCAPCQRRLPKTVTRCDECGMTVRQKARHPFKYKPLEAKRY